MEAIARFSNCLPVQVTFGAGTLGELPAAAARLRARRAFALVDESVGALPEVDAALAALAGECDVLVERAEPGEPSVERIDETGERLRVSGCDLVVALGGGSVIDTAKGARLVASARGPFRRFAWPGRPEPVPAPTLSLIAVPTTAGTGSEVTGGIVAVDRDAGRKVGAASPLNRADAAIVDPLLTRSVPREATMFCGVDALAQGLAAVVVQPHTPVGDAIGLEATRLAAAALPRVLQDLLDEGARSHMACASLLAGLAMNLSEAGTEHSLAHALGVVHGLPHGLAVGLVLAETMERDRVFVPARFERIADALGVAPAGAGDGARAVRGVRSLLAEVGFPTLSEVGVTDADVPELVDVTLDGWIPVEPGPWTRDDVAAAFRDALSVVVR